MILKKILDDVYEIICKKSINRLNSMKFKAVVSYTTRPMRDYETDGKEHKFISNEQANDILSNTKPVAYTEIGEYKYFILEDQIQDLNSNLYIIDPNGIYNLYKNKDKLNRKFIILYIKTSNAIRDKRAKSRSGYNEEIYKTRVKSENNQFENFEKLSIVQFPTYIINNNKNTIGKTIKHINKILLKTYDENTMYLIVGRTCSGKDTICNQLVEGNKYE